MNVIVNHLDLLRSFVYVANMTKFGYLAKMTGSAVRPAMSASLQKKLQKKREEATAKRVGAPASSATSAAPKKRGKDRSGDGELPITLEDIIADDVSRRVCFAVVERQTGGSDFIGRWLNFDDSSKAGRSPHQVFAKLKREARKSSKRHGEGEKVTASGCVFSFCMSTLGETTKTGMPIGYVERKFRRPEISKLLASLEQEAERAENKEALDFVQEMQSFIRSLSSTGGCSETKDDADAAFDFDYSEPALDGAAGVGAVKSWRTTAAAAAGAGDADFDDSDIDDI